MLLDKCGHCKNWMKKSDCPKEEKLKPTMETLACSKFIKVEWVDKSK